MSLQDQSTHLGSGVWDRSGQNQSCASLWLSNTSKVVWVCFFIKLYFLAKKMYQMEEL